MVSLEQQISVFLEHPLVLLLIGAGVSGLLVAWLTNRWEDRRKQQEIKIEDHRKELEIKVDMASKMSELIADEMSHAFIYVNRGIRTIDATEEKALSEREKNWFIDGSIIRLKLESYFPEADIKQRWEEYFFVLHSFTTASVLYFLKNPTADKRNALEYHLKEIRNYFSDNKQIDWDRLTTKMTYDANQWQKIMVLIGARGEKIIRNLNKLPMKVF
jgi:hypothetical protein